MSRKGAARKQKRGSRSFIRRLTRGPGLLGLMVVGAFAAFAAIIAVSELSQGGGGIERIQEISAEGRTRGAADAPVTIIEFADFQCPMCRRFAETTGNQIEEEYVANDLVRIEFRNMAFIGSESVQAAEAAQCANDQGMFWEYHDLLFDRQQGENGGAFAPNRLKRFAGDLELDQETFDECLDSGQHRQLVLDETDAAEDAGVTSTPWLFVNGETVKGAQPFGVFQQVIEQKLEEAAASP